MNNPSASGRGTVWLVLAAPLLFAALVFAYLASNDERFARIREHGLVAEGVVAAKREVHHQARSSKESSYTATVIDLRYNANPNTTWAKYIANGEKLDPPQGSAAEVTQSMAVATRAEFDSIKIGDRIMLAIDPQAPERLERASEIGGAGGGKNWIIAVILALAGLGAGFMWWRARNRARGQ